MMQVYATSAVLPALQLHVRNCWHSIQRMNVKPFQADTFSYTCSTLVGVNPAQKHWSWTFYGLADNSAGISTGWEVALQAIYCKSQVPKKIPESTLYYQLDTEDWLAFKTPATVYQGTKGLVRSLLTNLPDNLRNKVALGYNLEGKLEFSLESNTALLLSQVWCELLGFQTGYLESIKIEPGRTLQNTKPKSFANLVSLETNFTGEASRLGRPVTSISVLDLQDQLCLRVPTLNFFDVTSTSLSNIEFSFRWLDTNELLPWLSSPDVTLDLVFRRRIPFLF